MDYIARFGLEFNPFLKNSREIIIENDEYQEIMFRLGYLVETKGFGLLTGSPGLGKTTAIRNFAASLNPAKYRRDSAVDMTEDMLCSAVLRAAPANHFAL